MDPKFFSRMARRHVTLVVGEMIVVGTMHMNHNNTLDGTMHQQQHQQHAP